MPPSVVACNFPYHGKDMSYDTLKYWIALKFVEDIGNVNFNNLVKTFGSPKDVFNASVHALTKLPRITRKTASKIREFKDWDKVERELELAEKSKVSILTSQNPHYPKALLNIYDFPPILYVKGAFVDEDICVAVVGSRIASTYGKFITERLCRELTLAGITTVSGMARGIDSAAHMGSLAGKGRTVAVLGSGIDVIYPPENKRLYEKISSCGAVITEFPFSTLPKGPNFPARNRIISGMSLGVVVVEANEKSGSLITARTAIEQGREVFAIPGGIDSPGSRGTHKLIKEGAKLVENVYDILEEILPQVERKEYKIDRSGEVPQEDNVPAHHEKLESLEKNEELILRLICRKPVQVDSLITESGFMANDILNILLSLELKGYIDQLPGKRFKIKE